jgi:16S rRNA (adenine1518-N6/adenine1519-N6)-dimethyltransferase
MGDRVKSDTIGLLKRYGIRANKSFGQNFLINEKIIDDIISYGEISKSDGVIEIGPGLGAMTAKLATKAQKVVAIEIDRNMLKPLSEVLVGVDNVSVVNQDILKTDVAEIINSMKVDNESINIKVIANLPYYITTPIIMKLLEGEYDICCMEFMVQKEVAERICATPGGKEYGALTLAVQFYSSARIVMSVGPENFVPEPKVASSVVRMEILKERPVKVENEKLLFAVIAASFSQRRKTILNSLGNSGVVNGGKKRLEEILNELGINPSARAETISLKQYAEITNYL